MVAVDVIYTEWASVKYVLNNAVLTVSKLQLHKSLNENIFHHVVQTTLHFFNFFVPFNFCFFINVIFHLIKINHSM